MIRIARTVETQFPGLRIYAVGPLSQKQKLLDLEFANECTLTDRERSSYPAFRKKREALTHRQFLLAIETYANFKAPDMTLESQVRQVSAATGIPLAVIPTAILKKGLRLRFSKPSERLKINETES